MCYSKPLIISDNINLCKHFADIIIKLNIDDKTFTYSISPFSNLSDFSIDFPQIKVYDLKNKSHVEEIISTYDIVFSIHCKQLFPEKLVEALKCINIHPGYNPINRGWYPQVFSIILDLPIGATIHEIDEKLDHGPIIDRCLVEKFDFDTSETLYKRVLDKEVELLEKNILSILENKYETYIPSEISNLFLKKDFNNLLEIDLNEQVTYKQAIDRLRATSHGTHLNAYFINEKGKKIYIKFDLVEEKL